MKLAVPFFEMNVYQKYKKYKEGVECVMGGKVLYNKIDKLFDEEILGFRKTSRQNI